MLRVQWGTFTSIFQPVIVSFAAPPKSGSCHRHTSWQESIQTCSGSCRSGISIWCTFGNVSQGPCMLKFVCFSYLASSSLHCLTHLEVVWCDYFNQDENRRQEEREWMGEKFLVHFFDHEMEHKKYIIWGLTAGILIRAASVVYQRPPAFLELSPRFKVPQVVTKDSVLPWVQYLLCFVLRP